MFIFATSEMFYPITIRGEIRHKNVLFRHRFLVLFLLPRFMNRFKENFSGNVSAKKNKIVIQIENSKSCNISNARLNCIIHDLSHYPPLNGQFWKLKINKGLKI